MKKKNSSKEIILHSEKDFPLMPMSLGSYRFNKTGSWRNIKPVVDSRDCIQCGICWKFCPDVAVSIKNEFPVIDYDYCKGCGICAEECPKKCIDMVEEKK